MKIGRPAAVINEAHTYLLVQDDNKKIFLEKLKSTFQNLNPKEFVYLLISLQELNLLKVEHQSSVFNSFKNHFGGNYGTITNCNNHWRLKNDINLLKNTKKKINDIKFLNVIS